MGGSKKELKCQIRENYKEMLEKYSKIGRLCGENRPAMKD